LHFKASIRHFPEPGDFERKGLVSNVDFRFARHPCKDWAGRMVRVLLLLGEQHAEPEEPTEITTQL